VISDIENSTTAIEKGLYKEVNSISTASIAAMTNALMPLEVPYVFGGDGATLCIPESKKSAVACALTATKILARDSFNLDMRIGMVPARTIRRSGHQVLVGKYQPSDSFQQAMFQGDGLGFAEMLVKGKTDNNPYLLDENEFPADGNFEGFECRWNEIPSSHEETVSIIIQDIDRDNSNQIQPYEDILEKITQIYGAVSEHHPLLNSNLGLTLSPKKLSIEARIRTPLHNRLRKAGYFIKLWLLTLAGKYLMAKKAVSNQVDWGQYKDRLINNTDFRKFDENLRMVISGSLENRRELCHYLHSLHSRNRIVYGVHPSPAAIITCVVSDYDNNHIHFLDGSNGGYALAAKAMKKQIRALKFHKTTSSPE
jgi:hypothetical protein